MLSPILCFFLAATASAPTLFTDADSQKSEQPASIAAPIPVQVQEAVPIVPADEFLYAEKYIQNVDTATNQRQFKPVWATIKRAKLDALLASSEPTDLIQAYSILRMAHKMPELDTLLPGMRKHVMTSSEDLRNAVILVASEYNDYLIILPFYRYVLEVSPYSDDRESVLQELFNMPWCRPVEQLVASALWDKNEDVREVALSVINNSIDDSYDSVETAQQAYKKLVDELKNPKSKTQNIKTQPDSSLQK